MRKLLISLAATAATLGVAAPASAQVFGNIGIGVGTPAYGNMTPYGYGYNHSPYSYGYGYNGYAFVQQMQGRVQQIRSQIRNMAARRILSFHQARRLDREARAIQRRIYRAPRGGIRPQEARGIENRIRNLEFRVSRQAWNGNRYYGRGYNRSYGDRDWDHRRN